MNNIIDFKNQKVSAAFAHLKVNKSLGDGITAGFPVLNIRGKTWRLRYQGQVYEFKRSDDGSLLTYLDIVILNAPEYTSRIYFPKWEGEEGGSDGPLCASTKGDVPDPGVPVQQAKVCGTCPRSQWTTKPDGKRTPECQLHKRLAILLMPAMTKKMLGAPLTEPVFFKVPPGSLGSLKAYGDMLDHANIPFAAVLTRISFDPVKQFQINFEPRQTLDDKEAPLVLPLIDDPRTKRIIGEVPLIREVKATPIKPVEPVRIETGLMEAFSGEEPEPQVSPKPVVTRIAPRAPDPVQEIDPEQEVIPPPPVKKRGRPAKVPVVLDEAAVDDEPALPFTAGDEEGGISNMDDKIAALLNQKIDGMLK